MNNNVVAEAESRSTGRLSGSLGTFSIVFMVVAAASPLVVIGSVTPLGILIGNGIGFPALFAVSAVILLLVAVGLVAMTRHVPKPGAFFTFVGYGLGPVPAVVASWLAILTYTSVQISLHSYLGYLLDTTVQSLGGPAVPWWLYSLLLIAIVGVLGYQQIDVSSRVLGVFLVLEIAIVLALVAVVVATGGDSGLDLTPFAPANVLSGAPGIGLMFAIASFIGFEATAVFRDEARNPDRTIPRATYIAVIGIGVFYTLAAWALVMAWGPDNVVAKAAEDPGQMILATMLRYLGPAGEVGVNILLLTAMFAAILSFHTVLTRYLHSMASAGVLPHAVASVHSRHGSPHRASLLQTATAAALIVVFAVLGLDPVFDVFTPLGGVGILAIVPLIALTSIAILVYFARTRADRRIWNTVLAPVLGLIGIVGAGVVVAIYFPLLVGDENSEGVPTAGWLTLLLVAVIVAFPVFGLLQALVLRARRPREFARLVDRISN